MILLIDNYDSFTYNIFQYLKEVTPQEIRVVRNDCITTDEIDALQPDMLIAGPGPGRPEEAGRLEEIILHCLQKMPILGICLGHQAIVHALGGKIVAAKHIVHGKSERIQLNGKGLYRAIPSPAVFTRYHSLVAEHTSLPRELEVSARSEDGEIMGVQHSTLPVEGIQFHPESIASEYGHKLLKNFVEYQREPFPVRETLLRCIAGEDLSFDTARGFMDELTAGNLSPSQTSAYLTALNAKGITAGEIAGCASVLQNKRVPISLRAPVLDTCGTGGDGAGSFNISSMAALIAAGAGAAVAKHGNRAVSSLSGSADFYAKLGLSIDLKPEESETLINDTGFGFLFAPIYHSAMKHAGVVRRELGFKTIMNLLGPLSNPAGAKYQLLGVYDPDYCLPMAQAAVTLGVERVLVVHGNDGLDEISISAPSKTVYADAEGKLEVGEFNPEDHGLSLYPAEELQGGSAEDNAAEARRILDGEGRPAIRASVLLNAGAALYVYGAAGSIIEGFRIAEAALESGQVAEKIQHIQRVTEALQARSAAALEHVV
ncbi:MAG: bifunctional anthranilate synthase component II/anthranilate phosphoribosyltransferase [Spirochaetia bacterium]|nr:bifunctional anthranilate synthase component II/anthranilate phosphoribosyltransferase [Spirochaetia bacterium]